MEVTHLSADTKVYWKKILIKITVLAQYSYSIFIFLFILYCRIVQNMVLCMKFYISLCISCSAVISYGPINFDGVLVKNYKQILYIRLRIFTVLG